MEPINFSKKLVYALSLTLLIFTGCKKDDEEDPKPGDVDPIETENTLTAIAGKDTTIQVGTLLQMDGSGSKDSKNGTFNFNWAVLTKPASSDAKILDAATSTPSFTPDKVGDYEIELKISNEGHQSKDRLKVHAIAATPLSIDQSIDVKTVLEDRIESPEFPDYVVTADIGVSAELTIKPGVVIAFERNVRFSIDGEGVIIAEGTADKKIKFQGMEDKAGYWRGIIVYSVSNANTLSHAEIRNAGSTVMLNGTKSALTIFGYESQISLKNSMISDNEGYGMFVSEGGIIREFEANTFERNTEAGILLAAENVVKLDHESRFTGQNGRDVVEVMSNSLSDSNDELVVWAGFEDNTPYLITTDLSVSTGWKLNPGVKVKMGRDVRLAINYEGYLIAEGDADNRVVITGAEETPGYWRGLIIYSTSAMNLISYAEVSNAGSNAIVSGVKANIAIYGSDSYLSINNSDIKGCTGYGIYVSYNGVINENAETLNQFTNNTEGAILKD